jgi:hypothetical protein
VRNGVSVARSVQEYCPMKSSISVVPFTCEINFAPKINMDKNSLRILLFGFLYRRWEDKLFLIATFEVVIALLELELDLD